MCTFKQTCAKLPLVGMQSLSISLKCEITGEDKLKKTRLEVDHDKSFKLIKKFRMAYKKTGRAFRKRDSTCLTENDVT